MLVWTLIFAILSGLALLLNFFDVPKLIYTLVLPLVMLIGWLVILFQINASTGKTRKENYEKQIAKLKDELERTKHRVITGETSIHFPEGYVERGKKLREELGEDKKSE